MVNLGRASALYPFAPAAFTTPAGARMSYLDEGPRSREAVLMVHGNPTWSFYYRDLVRELSPGIRCVAPDHVGMGLSEKPWSYDYTLEGRIRDLAALVESLGLRKIHLVVHDWGGPIGLGAAMRMPQAVGRIVVMNTAAFAGPLPARIAVCRLPIVGAAIVRGLNGFAGPAARMAMSARRLTREERSGYLWPYRDWPSRIAVHRFVRDIPMEADHPSRKVLDALTRGLGAFRGSKMIVWGCRDFCFSTDFLARWRAIWPDARVEALPYAGHYVLEDGGPEVRRLIAQFIAQPNET